MTANEYQKNALRTVRRPVGPGVDLGFLLEGAMGLNGESGECIDLLKKLIFQGHELDTHHVALELGDIAWYLAVSAKAIGLDLETIFQLNIDKLKRRYPNGFSEKNSVNRSADDL